MHTPLSRRNSAPSLVASFAHPAAAGDEATSPSTPRRPSRADTPGLGVLPGLEPPPAERRPVAVVVAEQAREGKQGAQAPRKNQIAAQPATAQRGAAAGADVASLLPPALSRRSSIAGFPAGDRSVAGLAVASRLIDSEAPAYAAVRTWRQRHAVELGRMLVATPPPSQAVAGPAALPRNALKEDPPSLMPGLLAPYRRLLRAHDVPVPGEARPDPRPATGPGSGHGELLALIAFLNQEVTTIHSARARGLPEPLSGLYRDWAAALEAMREQALVSEAMRASRSPGRYDSPPSSGLAAQSRGEVASGAALVAGGRVQVAGVRPSDHAQALR